MITAAPSIWTPPALWTPRAAPWWKRPRWTEAMMAHLKKGASGHLLKKPTGGHLVKGCSAGGAPCDACPNHDEPLTMTAVIAGATLCTCFSIGTDWYSQLFDIHGTFTLTQAAIDPCSWIYRDDSVNFTGVWTNSSCSGSAAGMATGVEIRLQKQSFGGYFWIASIKSTGGNLGFQSDVFSSSVAGAATCAPASIVLTNTYTTCGDPGDSGIIFATGGTMTVTPD